MKLEEIMNIPHVKVLLDILKVSNTETYDHSLSVGYIIEMLVRRLPYTEEEKTEVIIGALLHDIGKIFLPLNLTQYPGGLSEIQFEIVKTHPAISYEIVKSTFSEIVQNICLYHHEKLNGQGYIKHIKDIPKEALLVAVADIFDALTSERKYKNFYSDAEAISILKKEVQNGLLSEEYVLLLEDIIKENK